MVMLLSQAQVLLFVGFFVFLEVLAVSFVDLRLEVFVADKD